MNIQIIGTKKCNETKKAERFFKERKIPMHFRDLAEKNLSEGELQNITRKFTVEDFLDREGKHFKKRGLQYMVFNVETELLEDYELVKTPIVRNGNEVTIGYQPEVWKKWLENT
ncbi:MAG: ArsC family transcriptional regulator [Ignavibacteriales bacterium]|nr:ArsC family transcriptional regulator [Ignavibacteriales bacterium]